MNAAAEPRAPAIALKLEAARATLQDLHRDVAQARLEASEDKPGAQQHLADVRSRLDAAEREERELEGAYALAKRLDRESLAASAIAMRAEQRTVFRKHLTQREKYMAVALHHAAEMAKAYTQFQLETQEMVSVLPSGTALPTLAMGINGLSGNLIGGGDRLLLAEIFRTGAIRDERGRRAVIPFSKPQVLTMRDEPEKIPAGLEVLREAHDALLREIDGQIANLDGDLLRRASAVDGVAA